MNSTLRQVRDEQAFNRLVDILRKRFAAEGSLPAERTMAKQLNVKRHQLRGALEVLRANGEIGPPTSRRGGSGLRREESLIRERFRHDHAYDQYERGRIDFDAYFSTLRTNLGVDISDPQLRDGWNAILSAQCPEYPTCWRALPSASRSMRLPTPILSTKST